MADLISTWIEKVREVYPDAFQSNAGRIWTSQKGFRLAGHFDEPTKTPWFLGETWAHADAKLAKPVPAVPAVGSFYECRTDLGPVVFQVKGVEAGYVVLASAETGTVGSVPAEMWDRDHRLGGVRLVDDTACIA